MYLIAGVRIFENLQVGGGSGAGGFEVHEGVVAAVAGCGAGDFALEVGDELHCLAEQGEDLLGLRRALDDEIVAGAAAHGAPVDDALRAGSRLGAVMRMSKVVMTSPEGVTSRRLT